MVPLEHHNKVVPPDKRAPFSQIVPRGTVFPKTVPFQQNGHYFGAPGARFFNKKLETVPQARGTKVMPLWKRVPFPIFFSFFFFCKIVPLFLEGHYFSAPLPTLQCFCIENVWKNSALLESGTKTVLWMIKRCPKGTSLVPLIFLSEMY